MIRVTNALAVEPVYVVWNALAVIGKSGEFVSPVTQALPFLSTVMAPSLATASPLTDVAS